MVVNFRADARFHTKSVLRNLTLARKTRTLEIAVSLHFSVTPVFLAVNTVCFARTDIIPAVIAFQIQNVAHVKLNPVAHIPTRLLLYGGYQE